MSQNPTNCPPIRLECLPRKTQEALWEFMRCVNDKLTGDLRFDFKDGVPQLHRRTETTRYSRQ